MKDVLNIIKYYDIPNADIIGKPQSYDLILPKCQFNIFCI